MANQTRILCCVLLLLILSGGSETRSLNPTMVSDHHMFQTSNFNWNSVDPVAEENDGKFDEQRLSPGGPDGHHH